MRIDNYSYRPTFQRLEIDDATMEYIVKNTQKKYLPGIMGAFDLFENSAKNFSFSSAANSLLVKVQEEKHPGRWFTVARYPESNNLSIIDIFGKCLTLVEAGKSLRPGGKAPEGAKFLA